MKEILPVAIFKQQFTSTATPAEIDLAKYYVSPGKRGVMATLSVISAANAASDSGSVAVKLQSAATTVDSDFVDITGAGFATVIDTDAPTTGGSLETIYFALPNDRYVRGVATVAGTPILDCAATLYLVKRSS